MIGRFIVEGDALLVPARAAYLLDPILHIERERLRLRGHDQQIDAVLAGWRELSLRFERETLGTPSGTALADGVRAGALWTTTEVAERAGVSKRAVRKAVADGRIVGALFAGRWSFAPADVAAFLARRAA